MGALLALYPGTLPALPTQMFQVSASVVAGCRVQGGGVVGLVDFGTHSGIDNRPVRAAMAQNASISIACTPGITLAMAINGGSHFTTTRNLQRVNYTELIGYRLFNDASFASASEILVNQKINISYSNGDAIQLPIYGQLQLNGFNPAGTYSDTLAITLAW